MLAVSKTTNPKTAKKAEAVAFKLPVGRREERDPRALDEHPLLRRLVPGLGSEEENEELRESLAGRQYRPILVTGAGCITPADTVLDGRRLRRAAMALGLSFVAVEVIDELGYAEEIELIVHSNLAAGLARRYDERRKAELERAVIEALGGDRQGSRADRELPSERKEVGETPELVVNRIRELHHDGYDGLTARAVRDRQRIFFDPVSPELLREAVSAAKIARRPAADLVAKYRRELTAHLKEDTLAPDQVAEHPAVVAARAKLFAEVHEILHGGKPGRTKSVAIPKARTGEGALMGGQGEIDNFLGRRVRVTVTASKVVLADLGEGADERTYRPHDRTTRTSWIIDTAEAVRYLPEPLRHQLTVHEVERLDPMRCPRCLGTQFRTIGGCASCESEPRTRGMVETEVLREMQGEIDAAYRRLLVQGRTGGAKELDQAAIDLRYAGVDDPRRHDPAGRAMQARIWDNALSDRVTAEVSRRVAGDPTIRPAFRIVDLRHPRTRIRLETSKGTVPIVLWEKVSDALPGWDAKPGIIINPIRVVRFHTADPEAKWHTRIAFVNMVYQELLGMLDPTSENPSWWGEPIARKQRQV